MNKQRRQIALLVLILLLAKSLAAIAAPGELIISYPLQGALFPSDFRTPSFRWQDTSTATSWSISVHLADAAQPVSASVRETNWRPDPAAWNLMKTNSAGNDLAVEIAGFADGKKVSGAAVAIRISGDSVDAPIFYREAPLPVMQALKAPEALRWRLGRVDREEPPPVVMEKVAVCANCHSFDREGTVMGMDADYKGDKGAYVIADIREETRLAPEGVISWSTVKPVPGVRTFGLFAQISPDGRYVASTVNDVAVYKMMEDMQYSQLFFPIQGQVAVYDRQEKRFDVLAGADDPDSVQSNPVFSPDGKSLVFIRGKRLDKDTPAEDFMARTSFYAYDLYRLPFPNDEGASPVKVKGASDNGMSNYFPKFSPDGKWIVFTRSKGFMIIQPDSQLVIIPAEGGEPRVMNCNFEGRMNSWHSFSPNGKWLVFSAKSDGPYTKLWLTHIDENGEDSVPVLLEDFTLPDMAANLPEFVNIDEHSMKKIINEL